MYVDSLSEKPRKNQNFDWEKYIVVTEVTAITFKKLSRVTF